MKRKIYEKLINWKNNGMKKPLMIIGARQVGKTYIINEFCKKEYKNAIQINLLNHPEIVELYKQNISLEEKYIRLCANLNINPNFYLHGFQFYPLFVIVNLYLIFFYF